MAPRKDQSPRENGLYWLALDDGADYEGPAILARVTVKSDGYGGQHARVDFLHPASEGGFSAERRTVAETWAAIADRTIHRISWPASIGGFIPTSTVGEYRLTWLGNVAAPKLPEVRPTEDVASNVG